MDDAARSGRPRATRVRQDRHVTLSHLRDRFHPVTRTAAISNGTHQHPVSANTIGHHLRERH